MWKGSTHGPFGVCVSVFEHRADALLSFEKQHGSWTPVETFTLEELGEETVRSLRMTLAWLELLKEVGRSVYSFQSLECFWFSEEIFLNTRLGCNTDVRQITTMSFVLLFIMFCSPYARHCNKCIKILYWLNPHYKSVGFDININSLHMRRMK